METYISKPKYTLATAGYVKLMSICEKISWRVLRELKIYESGPAVSKMTMKFEPKAPVNVLDAYYPIICASSSNFF